MKKILIDDVINGYQVSPYARNIPSQGGINFSYFGNPKNSAFVGVNIYRQDSKLASYTLSDVTENWLAPPAKCLFRPLASILNVKESVSREVINIA